MQENTICVQIVPGMRFLEFDFGVYLACYAMSGSAMSRAYIGYHAMRFRGLTNASMLCRD
eukprot:2702332-Rhodomonas_salina.3